MQCLSVFLTIVWTVLLPVNTLQAASHHPQSFLQSVQGTPDEGRQIYRHFCANCHAKTPAIPLGAPRYKIKKEWDSRLHQEIALLLEHMHEGLHAMPARGGCFECSDEQLALALVAMVPNEAQKALYFSLIDYKKNNK